MANRTVDRAYAPRASENRAGSARTISVLVVDDDHDSADGIAMLLRQWNHCVAVAYEGRRAIRLFRSQRPDLVLLDIDLPGMDGYELAGLMRLQRRAAFLVALTGNSDRKRSIAAGFTEHIRKPINLDALRDLISGL